MSHRLDAFRPQMGKVPDAQIARESGYSVRTVLVYRRRAGIRPYDRHTRTQSTRPQTTSSAVVSRRPMSSPTPASRPAPAGVRLVWLVTFAARKPGVVIARNIVEAVELGGRAGRVTRIECRGKLLGPS